METNDTTINVLKPSCKQIQFSDYQHLTNTTSYEQHAK